MVRKKRNIYIDGPVKRVEAVLVVQVRIHAEHRFGSIRGNFVYNILGVGRAFYESGNKNRL